MQEYESQQGCPPSRRMRLSVPNLSWRSGRRSVEFATAGRAARLERRLSAVQAPTGRRQTQGGALRSRRHLSVSCFFGLTFCCRWRRDPEVTPKASSSPTPTSPRLIAARAAVPPLRQQQRPARGPLRGRPCDQPGESRPARRTAASVSHRPQQRRSEEHVHRHGPARLESGADDAEDPCWPSPVDSPLNKTMQTTSRYSRCQGAFPLGAPLRPVATLTPSQRGQARADRAAPAPALASSTQIAPITSTLPAFRMRPRPVTDAETGLETPQCCPGASDDPKDHSRQAARTSSPAVALLVNAGGDGRGGSRYDRAQGAARSARPARSAQPWDGDMM